MRSWRRSVLGGSASPAACQRSLPTCRHALLGISRIGLDDM